MAGRSILWTSAHWIGIGMGLLGLWGVYDIWNNYDIYTGTQVLQVLGFVAVFGGGGAWLVKQANTPHKRKDT